MTDINSVIVVGRLTQDVGNDERSFGYCGNGNARANISLAVNKGKKQGEQWVEDTYFIPVTIWGKTAENLKPYLTKGTQLVVKGYLKQDRWEKNGQKQSRLCVVAEDVELCGSRQKVNQNITPEPRSNQRFPSTMTVPVEAEIVANEFEGEAFPEDLF